MHDSTPKSFSFVEPVDLVSWLKRTPVWTNAPLAPAVLVYRENQPHPWEWRVVLCPYCGLEHRHHSGFNPPLPGDDPRRYLGGRKAHCYQYNYALLNVEYRLVAIDVKYVDLQELRGFFPRAKRAVLPASQVTVSIKVIDDLGGIEIIEPGVPGRQSMSRDLRAAVWHKTSGRCGYCGVLCNPFDNLHIDHIHPVSLGGDNDLDNLMVACRSCNLHKHALSLDAYRERRGGVLFWFEVEEMDR